MLGIFVGTISGITTILVIAILKDLQKPTIYGLILAGIGFLYPGFTWSDPLLFLTNSIQAIFFLLLAYYGIQKGLHISAFGFFLHGIWDIVYHLFSDLKLIPPQYPEFCSSLDFTIGLYLIYVRYFKP